MYEDTPRSILLVTVFYIIQPDIRKDVHEFKWIRCFWQQSRSFSTESARNTKLVKMGISRVLSDHVYVQEWNENVIISLKGKLLFSKDVFIFEKCSINVSKS